MVLKPAISATSDTPEFSVSDVVTRIREALFSLPDTRRGGNHQRYVMGDAGLSAFSVFFMQSPSFLDDQQRMQKELGCNNASSLFGVHQIPSTQQICNLLDPVSPAHLAPVFIDLVEALHQHGSLNPYRGADGRLLVALDGTEYHCSESIHCPGCSTRTLANGKTQYHHSALTPVIVAPGQSAVFALPPEFIRPQDGLVKQDCELNAGTRWLQQWGPQIAAWGTTVLGRRSVLSSAVLQSSACPGLRVCLRLPAPLASLALRVDRRLRTHWADPYAGQYALDRKTAPDRYLSLAQ